MQDYLEPGHEPDPGRDFQANRQVPKNSRLAQAISESTQMTSSSCPRCLSTLPLTWIHGHGQCDSCKFILHPCCEGSDRDAACPVDLQASRARLGPGASTGELAILPEMHSQPEAGPSAC